MRGLTLFVILAMALGATAQQVDVAKLKGLKARNIGPAGMSGRVTSIDVVNANPEVIYVGTASGGVWRSESGGIKWEPIFDDQPTLSIGAVAIQQSNPDVIWAGTGEGNPRNSQSSGAGIYKSVNGGKTWQLMGLENTKTIHRIIIHRDNPDVVFAAAMGSAWGPNPERGVYRTKNGGKTWDKVLFANDTTGCADLVVDPSNPNKLIAAMWQYHRKPWFFTSGGQGSGLYVSFDGGDTWSQRTDKHGLPEGELGRIGLAIAPSNPKRIYALVESKKLALYRSDDGGFNWSKISDKNVGNRPFYYADIYCDPHNENRVYNLWSYLSMSEDGGKTFTTIADYGNSVHPDHHAFWVHPDNPDFLIEGNDGGLNISHDRGKSWRFVENLPLAQFYHISVDNALPYNVYGGMQDNGSWRGPGYVWQRGGIRNHHWQELYFGDGFDVVPIPSNPDAGYTMSQGGNVARYDVASGKTSFIQPLHPEGIPLRFNWNAGIAQDPFDDCTVYFGSQFLHKSTNCGDSWKIISPDLTTNDTTRQKQANSGGLTIDATRAENFTTILSIAPSPADKKVIWVGTDDGNLQLTRDGGETWTNLASKLPGCPAGSWIPKIEASRHAAGEAYVIVNNYRRNDWKPYAYKTTDFGQSWTRIASPENISGYCLSIVQDPEEPRLLFMGTESGLYFSIDRAATWTKWGKDFPSVSTMDLAIQPREADLVIGTFGRAAWIVDDIRPLRQLAKEGLSMFDKPVVLFDPPTGYQTNAKSIGGVRFTGQAYYKGRNKRSGAVMALWLRDAGADKGEPSSTKASKGKKKTKGEDDGEGKSASAKATDGNESNEYTVQVFNAAGDTLRTWKLKPDTGLMRFSWSMRRKGVRYPSHEDVKPDTGEPTGQIVPPGTYKVKVTYQGNADSTSITIESDPRLQLSPADVAARDAFNARYNNAVDAAFHAFERLKEARKTIDLALESVGNAPDSVQKKLKKESNTLNDSISAYTNLFMKPKDFVGYDHLTIRLSDRVWTASRYINSQQGRPSGTAEVAVSQLETELNKALKRINGFFSTNWTTFSQHVEAASTSIFKDYEPIELE